MNWKQYQNFVGWYRDLKKKRTSKEYDSFVENTLLRKIAAIYGEDKADFINGIITIIMDKICDGLTEKGTSALMNLLDSQFDRLSGVELFKLKIDALNSVKRDEVLL